MSLEPLRDPELPKLVSEALEFLERGQAPPLEVICEGRADLLEPLRECVDQARLLPALQRGAPASPGSAHSLLGSTLGDRYRIEAPLGSGAMGVVYRAWDLQLERPVALKVLRAISLAEGEATQRFAREAQALATIAHPSVVSIHDRGRTPEGNPYLVMELLEGMSLDQLLELAAESGSPRAAEDTGWLVAALGEGVRAEASFMRHAVHWAAELADGLEAAHACGIVHRDVKPSNILITHAGRPVLIDFSIAKRLGAEALTHSGATVGTPAYMAPECLHAGHESGPALDVYGLGATLYHLLTLRAPYEGTPTQVLGKLASGEPPLATRIRPGLPRDLQAILEKAMNRSPRARYATAAAFEADLRAFLAHQPIEARPISRLRRILRRLGRSPALLSGLAVAIIALLWIGGTRWSEGRRARQEVEFWSHFRHLSPNLPILNEENRRTSSDAEYRHIRGLLDRSLAARPSSVLGRVTSASFWLDHAQPRRAARDMRVLASAVGSAYSDALAASYAALPSTASSARELLLDDLPPPTEVQDLYLAAFHAIRLFDLQRAREYLAEPKVLDYPPAAELATVLSLTELRSLEGPARWKRALEIYEEDIRLEERIGTRTATSAHIASYCLLAQRRFNDCLQAAREGLELAPFSHVLRTQAGNACFELGLTDQACDYYEQILDLRPADTKIANRLALTRIEGGDFAAVERLIERHFSDPGADEHGRITLWRAQMSCMRALAAWEEGKGESARSLASTALESMAEAESLGSQPWEPHQLICRAIVANDMSLLLRGFAERLEASPLHVPWLKRLLDAWPAELDTEDAAALNSFLRSLYDELEAGY